jgi:hypothetical protein
MSGKYSGMLLTNAPGYGGSRSGSRRHGGNSIGGISANAPDFQVDSWHKGGRRVGVVGGSRRGGRGGNINAPAFWVGDIGDMSQSAPRGFGGVLHKGGSRKWIKGGGMSLAVCGGPNGDPNCGRGHGRGGSRRRSSRGVRRGGSRVPHLANIANASAHIMPSLRGGSRRGTHITGL